MIERPRWLEDEEEIEALLQRFVDKLDKKPAAEWQKPPELKVSSAHCPHLFRNDEEADRSWALLKQLDRLGCLLIITKPKRGPFDPEYKDARLLFNLDFEETLRRWLNRPHKIAALPEWQAVVANYVERFPGATALLQARPIAVADRSAAEILDGFVAIALFQSQRLTLTQLSARCFSGQSKFLDGREELLASLYPDLQLTPRPIVINVHLPPVIEDVLLIENQDSYCSAIGGRPAALRNMALVYCAGFRGSAARIRSRDGVSFHYQGDVSHQQTFESWWFSDDWSGPGLHFWGDLDFSGMAILKALRQRFGVIAAWQPGYEFLRQQLLEGNGHTPAQGSKEEQSDPLASGCYYADTILLPLLRETGLFVDQEAMF